MNDDNEAAGHTDDDAILVAFLDGEMNASDSVRLTERLKREPGLRDRLETLRRTGPRIRVAFDHLLDAAPVDRMRARFDQALVARRHGSRVRWLPRATGAAALASAFFVGGFVTSRLVGPSDGPSSEDWRQAVAEYMEMYSPETFRPTESAALRKDLSSLGGRLGLVLDPDRLGVAGLDLRRAEILQYEGAPLGQVGYLKATTLIAFCILRDGEVDAPLSTSRQGPFSTASWAKAGRGYMLIGKLPTEQLAEVAGELKERF